MRKEFRTKQNKVLVSLSKTKKHKLHLFVVAWIVIDTDSRHIYVMKSLTDSLILSDPTRAFLKARWFIIAFHQEAE